ncbi:non-canonical purine NTP pyrophosphatase [Peptococcaceae bacterium 1198_IL3148]
MAYKAVYYSRPLRFISQNEIKIAEYKELMKPVNFITVNMDIPEQSGGNLIEIIRSKVLTAFEEKRAPLFVDQTGLYLDAWNGLPGGLTDIFWKRLKLTGFLKLLENENNRKAVAITTIGYCDGRNIHYFQGKLSGTIAHHPMGELGTQWDPVFIPQGENRTFAEMPKEDRLKISMRLTAATDFKDFLLKQRSSCR